MLRTVQETATGRVRQTRVPSGIIRRSSTPSPTGSPSPRPLGRSSTATMAGATLSFRTGGARERSPTRLYVRRDPTAWNFYAGAGEEDQRTPRPGANESR